MVETKRRVGVTGKNGQVSLALARALRDAGHEPIGFARPLADLSDPQSMVDAIIAARPDIVINAAAYTAVDRAEDESDLAFRINRDGAEAVARAAADLAIPVIHISTDYVFDGKGTRPYTETDPTSPIGVYGASKLAGERAVAAANPRHVILRTAWVFSEDANNFVKTMLRLAAERPELRVVADQHGTPTYAADLANAICQLLPQLQGLPETSPKFGILHATNAGHTTWHGFATAIIGEAARFGHREVPLVAITTAEFPTRAKRPHYSVLSSQKLRDTYGITLPVWSDALQRCLRRHLG